VATCAFPIILHNFDHAGQREGPILSTAVAHNLKSMQYPFFPKLRNKNGYNLQVEMPCHPDFLAWSIRVNPGKVIKGGLFGIKIKQCVD
jgi:hypothetical protein